ncbi:MAG: NUDIX hydrolase [Candidatus Scalindua sp.]
MATELIDIYDENLKLKGSMPRSQAHQEGEWHRSIHCWLIRPSNEGYVLFQKRGKDKKLFPNFLDITAAGHYTAGEKPEDGVREILEELGVDVKFEDLIPLGIKFDIAKINDVVNREFCDVYLLKRDGLPASYNMDNTEVEGLIEIKISEGLGLFSGELKKASARGVEWNSNTKKWDEIEFEICVDDVIPRLDPYYYKIFIMAERLLAGNKYLSI